MCDQPADVMDDFILPEDVEEASVDMLHEDASQGQATVSSATGRVSEKELDHSLTVRHCAQAMAETLKKHRDVKQRIAELDQLALQVRFLKEIS